MKLKSGPAAPCRAARWQDERDERQRSARKRRVEDKKSSVGAGQYQSLGPHDHRVLDLDTLPQPGTHVGRARSLRLRAGAAKTAVAAPAPTIRRQGKTPNRDARHKLAAWLARTYAKTGVAVCTDTLSVVAWVNPLAQIKFALPPFQQVERHQSVFRRLSDSSTTRRIRSGRLSSPLVPSILNPNFVAMATWLRTGFKASPTSSSLT